MSMQTVLSEVASERVRQDVEGWLRQLEADASREACAMLRAELIQAAAVAVAMVEALDRRTAREAAGAPPSTTAAPCGGRTAAAMAPSTTTATGGGALPEAELPEADLSTVESEG